MIHVTDRLCLLSNVDSNESFCSHCISEPMSNEDKLANCPIPDTDVKVVGLSDEYPAMVHLNKRT